MLLHNLFERRFEETVDSFDHFPFDHGAATATSLCLIFLLPTKLANSVEVKAVPLSETISEGLPKLLKTVDKLGTVSLVLVVLTGKSQVKRVNASITSNICLKFIKIVSF